MNQAPSARIAVRTQVIPHRLASRIVFSCLLLGASIWLTACRATCPGAYQPNEVFAYAIVPEQTLHLRDVLDQRTHFPPSVFFQSDHDKGCFARPLPHIVREALEMELCRAGLRLDSSPADLSLDCEILAFQAVVTEEEFKPSQLELSVILRFCWQEPGSERVLADNVRRLVRRRDLGVGEVVALPFRADQVRRFGQELLNDMLPWVIAAELTSNAWLSSPGQKKTIARRGFSP